MIPSSRPFHICYVEDGYPHPHGGGGGAGTYVQITGKELVRRGYRVSVVASWCPTCPEESLDDGVHVYRPKQAGNIHWYCGKLPALRIFSLSLRYLEFGWQTNSFVRKLNKIHPIDLVEYSEGGDFWHMFRPKYPYVVHLHGSRYTFLNKSEKHVGRSDWWHRKLELRFIEKANQVFSPCKALLAIVEKELGWNLKNSTIIPYPLDPQLEDYKPAPPENRNGKKVFFAARNDPVKGGQILLQAIPFIRHKVPDTKFEFFGFEPNHNNQRVENNICFNGFLPKAELLERYREADICIVPSLWDNSPFTVYEAMASGKAVVASKVGGISELIEDGETGILIESGNFKQLGDAIVELLLNDKRRICMGEKAREHILKVARVRENVDKRLDLYHDIVTKFSATKLN